MPKFIPLKGKNGKGKFAMVDDEDFEYLSQWSWHCNYWGYPRRGVYNRELRKTVGTRFMHQDVHLSRKPMVTDHINGDKLDNRRSNLRTVDQSLNNHNRSKVKARDGLEPTSQYKGVTWSKKGGTWYAVLNKRYLGSYSNEIIAAEAWDKAALEIWGKNASLNFN